MYTCIYIYIYMCVCIYIYYIYIIYIIYIYIIYIFIYNSKSLDVVQSLHFGSKLPKYRDCTTSNDFELYLMCCGVMLLLLIIYSYIYIQNVS